MQDCRTELHGLLKEEKLAGASLLILANKQDVPGALSAQQIEQARFRPLLRFTALGAVLARSRILCATIRVCM